MRCACCVIWLSLVVFLLFFRLLMDLIRARCALYCINPVQVPIVFRRSRNHIRLEFAYIPVIYSAIINVQCVKGTAHDLDLVSDEAFILLPLCLKQRLSS